MNGLLNDGILEIYVKTDSKTPGNKHTFTPIKIDDNKAFFDYLAVGNEEYYKALEQNIDIQKKVKIIRDERLTIHHAIKIEAEMFDVIRVEHRDGAGDISYTYRNAYNNTVPTTDLYLRKVVVKYDFAGI